MITKSSFLELFSFLHVDKVLVAPILKEYDLKSFQTAFNIRLNEYLEDKVNNYKNYSDNELCIESVEHAVSLIRDGGKRIRPYMAFTAFMSEGGLNQEEVLKAGIALEIFHAFALIHDDIIDKGNQRHGKDTTHVHIEKFVSKYPRGDKKHISESVAILAGDLIFSWSHEVIASLNNKKVQEIFFRMIEEVVAGQILDVSFMLQNEVDKESIFQKNDYKTALYSFVNPMLVGATLSGRKFNKDFYHDLGLCLGQAFQIQDDLLDIVGDESKTGKMNLLDVQDGQHTLLSQYIVENADSNDKQIFMALFGKEIDEYSRDVLLRLFEVTGAIKYAQDEIDSQFEKANKIILKSNIKPTMRDVWFDFIKLLDKRKF
jgi:geranylgeranyl diphosphate synthase type I